MNDVGKLSMNDAKNLATCAVGALMVRFISERLDVRGQQGGDYY
jgi:hypothetical protein